MNEAAAETAPDASQPEIGAIRGMLERAEWADAIARARDALARDPSNRDFLYALAVGLRYANAIPAALEVLARLEAYHPRYPRLFQERGHCHVARREVAPAIAAFERAVRLNPALPASWSSLQTLYRIAGRTAESANAASNVERLKGVPSEIVTAYSMFADGEITQSERLIRDFLLKHGDHVEAMRLLAKIGIEHNVLDDAELLLERVLALAPEHHVARFEYALALLKQHKHLAAQREVRRILAIDPRNLPCRVMDATLWLGLGQVEQAIELYRQLLAELPHDPEVALSLGHALKTAGRQAEAIDAYRTAAADLPRFGEPYWSLANLKTYRFGDADLASMRIAEADPTTQSADRYHFCFALGKALEDRGEYRESFQFYERGNALKHRECRYRPATLERAAALLSGVCTRDFFDERRGVGAASAAPIFIVGLPRSGSTLIEQILASHSEVEGTMELAEMPRLAGSLQANRTAARDPVIGYPDILGRLSAVDFDRLGEAYLTDTLPYRSGMPRFIDKNPNNFRHIALIHLVLPNAKIIDARREAMGCCFSNFKQLFASGQEFTYSLEDIARYYRMYLDLMAHWDQALPGKVLRVEHDQVVEDLSGSVRRILDFCELKFESACVDFHKTERRVHTASSEQVRRPINRDGVDQWRHFEPWLGPLKDALGGIE